MPEPTPPRDDDKEFDVDWLVSDPSGGKPAPARPVPSRAGPEEGYDLVGGEDLAAPEVAPAPPPIPDPPVRTSRPRPSLVEDEPPRRRPAEPEATVDQVWTRGAEWGPHLALLAAVAVVFLYLIYRAFLAANVGMVFFLLVLGAAALLVLCYPIFITLERPVRITPEQAARDYFSALSHLLPHYKRMWLLLSSSGRRSESFESFGGFKEYWKAKCARLKGSQGGKFTALRFEVADFQSDKGKDLTATDAKFTLNVFLGEGGGEPIESYWVKITMIKGPDRMWYLNKGTLPESSSEKSR